MFDGAFVAGISDEMPRSESFDDFIALLFAKKLSVLQNVPLTRALCEEQLGSELAEFCFEEAERSGNLENAARIMGSYLLLEIGELMRKHLGPIPPEFETEVMSDVFTAVSMILLDDALRGCLGTFVDDVEMELAAQYCRRVWFVLSVLFGFVVADETFCEGSTIRTRSQRMVARTEIWLPLGPNSE